MSDVVQEVGAPFDGATVYPTHTSFDDSVEIMKAILMAHPDAVGTDEFVIVHAVVAPYGEEMANSWIEAKLQDKVIFIGILNGKREMLAADRAEFYADVKVKETKRYTFLEAYHEEKRTGKFGPWDRNILELCRDYK